MSEQTRWVESLRHPGGGRGVPACSCCVCLSVVVSGCVSVSLSVCLCDCVCVCLALGVCVCVCFSLLFVCVVVGWRLLSLVCLDTVGVVGCALPSFVSFEAGDSA